MRSHLFTFSEKMKPESKSKVVSGHCVTFPIHFISVNVSCIEMLYHTWYSLEFRDFPIDICVCVTHMLYSCCYWGSEERENGKYYAGNDNTNQQLNPFWFSLSVRPVKIKYQIFLYGDFTINYNST